MARIVFLMLPEPGHLLPTFRIARGLLERGHEVFYLTLPEFRKDCEMQGFKFSPLLSLSREESETGSLFETRRAGRTLYQPATRRLRAEGRTILGDEREQIAAMRPGLLIVDTGVMVLESFVDHHGSPQDWADPLQSIGCRVLQMSPLFTDCYSGIALPRPGVPEAILCPQEFDLPHAWPAAVERYYVEPSVAKLRRRVPFSWEWIDRNKRLVYCSFGTQSSDYENARHALETVLHAFADDSEFQLVIAAGGHVEETTFGILPRNVLLRKSVPQLEILRHAAVMITHGGLGSLKEAILSAVPAIVIPFAVDQPFNALRVTHHGLGRAFQPQTVAPEDLTSAARELADEVSTRNRLLVFQEIFAEAECRAPSLSLIERLLAFSNPEAYEEKFLGCSEDREASTQRRQSYLNRRRMESSNSSG